MPMNVINFYKMRPKLPFRFKTKWFTGFKDDDSLTYCVTSITLPKIGIENNNGFVSLGDVLISNPTFSPGERKLEITFEESNYMVVSKFVDKLVTLSYSRRPYFITICIEQYDEHLHKIISKKGYICHLLSYDEPSFKREGQAQAVNISTTFIIDSIIENFEKSSAVYGYKTNQVVDGLNPDISSLVIDEQNTKFEWGNLKIPTNGNSVGNSRFHQADIKALRAEMQSKGIDTTNLSQVVEYLRNNTDYYSDSSNSRCATGVSLAVSIAEGKEEYTSFGAAGNVYGDNGGISCTNRTEMTKSEIDEKARNLKSGESFIVSFRDINDSMPGDSDSEKFGHVVIVSRDSTGKLTYTSDFKQKSWETYSNIDTLINNGAKFIVMDR